MTEIKVFGFIRTWERKEIFKPFARTQHKPGTPEWEEHMVQHMSKEQTAALWKHVVHSGASRHTS